MEVEPVVGQELPEQGMVVELKVDGAVTCVIFVVPPIELAVDVPLPDETIEPVTDVLPEVLNWFPANIVPNVELPPKVVIFPPTYDPPE